MSHFACVRCGERRRNGIMKLTINGVWVLAGLLSLTISACSSDPFDPLIGPRNAKKSAESTLDGESWSSPDDQTNFLNRRPVDPNLLRRLGKNNAPAVRALVAVNPATPPDLLRNLATDRDIGVRQYLVTNPSLSREFLLQIRQLEKSRLVLDQMIRNAAWTGNDLWSFYREGAPRYDIAINPSAPSDLLADLLRNTPNDESSIVLNGLVHNISTPPELIEEIVSRSAPGDSSFKLNALNSPSLTAKACQSLLGDPDERVRQNASRVCKRRALL